MECFYIWPDLVSLTQNSLRCQKEPFCLKHQIHLLMPDLVAWIKNWVCFHTKQHSGSATKLEYHDTIKVFHVVS